MTTDERLEALTVTVENLAGMAKDLLEKETRRDEWEQKTERKIEFLLQSQAKHEEQVHKNFVEIQTRMIALAEVTQTALEIAARVLMQTDNHEARITALERPSP